MSLVPMARISQGSEHQTQSAYIDWVRLHEHKYPELKLLYAIPNGALRNPRLAQWMLDEGLRAGVPDICLPVARGRYIALRLEFKHGDNRQTPRQLQFTERLRKERNLVHVIYTVDEAILVTQLYLKQVFQNGSVLP
jgi:hypothetical protein